MCTLEPSFRVASACTLSETLAALTERKPDVLVLDLALPEGEGLEAFRRIQAFVPGLPLVILATAAEEELARRALEMGASDYLLKGHIDHRGLLRVLQCVLWRGQEAARALSGSLMDELTGLYHRDGFLRMAVRHFEQARKQNSTLALLCVDVNDLDEIRRVHGCVEGDRALFDTAELLRKSFRRMDLLGRTGESEFSVLAIDTAGPSGPILRQRLERRLAALNQSASRPRQISLSIGVHLCRSARGSSLEDLFLAAEANLRTRKAEHVRRQAVPAGSVREIASDQGNTR
jgi:diguanylate cyclase (GGDEF)-like protein